MTDFATFATELAAFIHRHWPPAPTPAPPPVVTPPTPGTAVAVIRAVGAACPVRDNQGNTYDQSGQLASGADTITALLRAGVSPLTIETYLINKIKAYGSDSTPGGPSYAKGWTEAIDVQHDWDSQMRTALMPKGGVAPMDVPTTPTTFGPGPSIG